MSKKCSTCGAPAPDDTAVFCNRCGARLPAGGGAEVLTCRMCGKAVTDRQSRFCDRCGSPLVPAVQAAPPAPPAVRRRNCPACGSANFGENLFYCRKCGAILPKYESVPGSRPEAKAPSGRPQQGGISIIPDGMDEFRQDPVNAPGTPRQPSVNAAVALRRPPAAPVPPRKPPRGAPKQRDREYWRRVSIRAAWILLILLVIAAIVMIAPGILEGGSANTTAPASPGPGLQGGLLGGILPTQTPVINQGTPVVRDTPLLPKIP